LFFPGDPILTIINYSQTIFALSMQYICEKVIMSFAGFKLPSKYFLYVPILLFSHYIKAQTADEIINKYVEFIGGQKQWKAVKTIVTSGEYNYGGVIFPFNAFSKAPDLYKFVVTFKGKYYAQSYDGKAGWKIDVFNGETAPTLLSGKPATAMANEANVELEDALIDYKEKGHQANLEGKDSAGGRSCYKLKLIRKTGETETYYFDDKTSELVLKKAVAKNPELGGAIVNISYSDYRKVNDLRIAFKSVVKTEDQTILTIGLNKAEINTPIEDSTFQWQKTRGN